MLTSSKTHIFNLLRSFSIAKFLVIVCCFISAYSMVQESARAQESYTISVLPQSATSVIYQDWQPFIDYLNANSDLTFELSVQDSLQDFELGFLEAKPDFVFLSPYHMVMAFQEHGYIPLLSDASRQLKGILLVPKASELSHIEELHNKTVAFPAPNSFGASLYLRAYLDDVGIYVKPTYVGTHANAYRHAMLGEAAAAGGVYSTFHKESGAFRAAMRVLYETPGVTPHPLAVHPRVPEQVREAVVSAVLELSQSEVESEVESENGPKLLQAIQLTEPMQVNYEEHYQFLENYNLEEFVEVARLR